MENVIKYYNPDSNTITYNYNIGSTMLLCSLYKIKDTLLCEGDILKVDINRTCPIEKPVVKQDMMGNDVIRYDIVKIINIQGWTKYLIVFDGTKLFGKCIEHSSFTVSQNVSYGDFNIESLNPKYHATDYYSKQGIKNTEIIGNININPELIIKCDMFMVDNNK